MFSGFLTLGGFLLSLKTFIVVKMKEGVFDNEHHIKKVLKERERTRAPVKMYAELNRLRRLLFGAIGTAIMQVTLGLVDHLYATTICFAVAAFEIAIFAQALFLINKNLHDWFDSSSRGTPRKREEQARSQHHR